MRPESFSTSPTPVRATSRPTDRLNSGALTALAGSPFAAGTSPSFMMLHPSRPILYVVKFRTTPARTTASVSGYAIDATTGALTPIAAPVCRG